MAATHNMSLNLHIDSKGCTFLLKVLIWHLKAYAFVMECLSRLRKRERVHIYVAISKAHKTGADEEIKLLEVPFQKVSVKPGDVIVLMAEMALSEAAVKNLTASFKEVFPDNKITILEEGFKLGVMAKGEETT